MWVSEHKNKTVQRRAMDGSVITKVASHARTFVVGLNDNLFLLEDAGKLREVTAAGDAVREIALQNQPMALYVSPGGEIRVLGRGAADHPRCQRRAGGGEQGHRRHGLCGYS